MSFNADIPLVIAPGLRVRCEAADRFALRVGGLTRYGGTHTLVALNAFRHPRSAREALAGLRRSLTGVGEWMQLTETIRALVEAGALVPEAADAPARALDGSGFDGAGIHAAMLNDRVRTQSYLRAIAETVQRDDVVVDLGTGTGILAMAAARAGARRVYAIEATRVAAAAERLIADNNMADRITVLRGHSTTLELPERADLLVAEIIGDDPLGEQVVESTADAIKRILKPGARVLPSQLQIWAAPVALTENAGRQPSFDATSLADWASEYGFDFSALAEFEPPPLPQRLITATLAGQLSALGTAQRLCRIDLTQPQGRPGAVRCEVEMASGGTVAGLLLWFDLQLSDSQHIDTDPQRPRADNHWRHPLYLLPQPVPVSAGERWRFECALGASDPKLRAARLPG